MKKVGDKDARASQEIEQTRQILAQGKKKRANRQTPVKTKISVEGKNGYKEAKEKYKKRKDKRTSTTS